MGSDDFFKKKRAERKRRNYAYKQPKANSFLIVTEGEKTEPLYFKGLEKLINKKIGGNLDIYEMPVIEINGEGCATRKGSFATSIFYGLNSGLKKNYFSAG